MKTDELELVEAIDRYGSVGAAAKELLSTQPSASRKLARLERRLGLVLFERDTTGARATSAGRDLAQRSRQLLADLDALPRRLQALAGVQDLRLGTIQALAPMVFTAARFELPGIEIKPEIDHGPALIEMVQAGLLDAAIVAIAEQTPRMSGLQSTLVGTSPLVLVIPEGAGFGTGEKALRGREVLYSVFDLSGERLREGLAALGVSPRPGPTSEATLRIAREAKIPAVIPELSARWWTNEKDTILPSPVPGNVVLHIVTRAPGVGILDAALQAMAQRILGQQAPGVVRKGTSTDAPAGKELP